MGQCESENKEQLPSILNIPIEHIQSDHPIEAGLFAYPQRLFTLSSSADQLLTLSQNLTQNYSQITFNFSADLREQISLPLRLYKYLSDELRSQIKNLEIHQIFLDELNISKIIYSISQSSRNSSLFIRTFNQFDQDYLNIAYEINTYHSIAKIKSKYLHGIYKDICIVPEREVIQFYSHVAFLEPISCNLSMIIKQKRKARKMWNFWEFQQLFSDLVEGLSALHEHGLNHNDIRPSNVYYSQEKGCYLLGSFSNVTKFPKDKLTKNIKESNHYKDLYSTRRISRLSSFLTQSIDMSKCDVYSLGMTLLSAFYLCEPIDRKKCAPYNRALSEKFPYLSIIKEMVCKFDQRKSINEIRILLQEIKAKNIAQLPLQTSIRMQYQAKSMNNARRENYVAQCYKCLGMITKWKDKLKQIFSQKQSIENSYQNAKKFEQLAIASKIQGKIEKSMHEYIHSAEIYTNIGLCNFQQRIYIRAIEYFKKGLANLQKINEKQSHHIYLKLLINLTECQIISGNQTVNFSELSYIQSLIQAMKSKDLLTFWEYTQQLMNIYDYLCDYLKIKSLLDRSQDTIKGIKKKINVLNLQKRLIKNNLKLLNLQHNQQKQQLLNNTIEFIDQVFCNYEYYLLEHPLEKMEIEFLYLKAKLIQEQSPQHINGMVKILNELQKRMFLSQKQKKIQTQQRDSLLYLELSIQLGDAYFASCKDVNSALLFYAKAMTESKRFYGDIYNNYSAILLQKIGRANKSIDRFKTYLECIDLATKIYKAIYGRQHKYLLKLKKGINKDDLEETINPSASNSIIEEKCSLHIYE